MKKKILFAFTAVMMSSLYGDSLQAGEVTVSALTPTENEVVDQGPRPDPLDQGPPQDPLEQGPPSDQLHQVLPRDPLEEGSDDAATSYSEEAYDPLEPLNRSLFVFNQMLDGLILRPISVIYKTVLPEPVRDSIGNVLSNLWEPVSFVNYLLQGNPEGAGVAITRFTINSTLGIAGIMDVANTLNVAGKNTGFDDTLSVWGVGNGPYLMIPVLGPSTFRGAIGLAADYYADPFNYYLTHKGHKHKRRWIVYTRTGVEIIDQRYQLLDTMDELEANSIDFYAALRSIHFQRLAYKKQQQQRPQKKAEAGY